MSMDYNDYDNKRCYLCKEYFEIKNMHIIKHKKYKNQYACKRCFYFSTRNKKYGFKSRQELQEWYMKQWSYQLGYDPLGIPLPNPNPCPEWEGGAYIDHNHKTGKIRGLTTYKFNTSINMLFEYKTPKERQKIFDIICQWLDGTWKPNPEINKKYLQQIEKLLKIKEKHEKNRIEKSPKNIIYWFQETKIN